MRTKISKLAKGIFDKTIPELTVSVEIIQILLPTEGILLGNFSIDSQNGIDYLYGARCTCENGKRLSADIPLITQVFPVK